MKKGTTKELENHFWKDKKRCKWQLPIVGFVKKKFRKSGPVKPVARATPKPVGIKQPIPSVEPEPKDVIKTKEELEKVIEEIEEGE